MAGLFNVEEDLKAVLMLEGGADQVDPFTKAFDIGQHQHLLLYSLSSACGGGGIFASC